MGKSKELSPASNEGLSISVQRLNKSQAENMGLFELIEDGTHQAVAIKRGGRMEIIEAKIIEGVDLKRFVFGDEEYYDQVLLEAKETLSSD